MQEIVEDTAKGGEGGEGGGLLKRKDNQKPTKIA